MKQGQNARRSRSRAAAKRGGGGQQKGKNGNRSETRVKGNPKQLLEKYKSLARDALQSGDRVLAENYFQHADHYQRILNEWNGLSSGLFEDDADDGGRGRGRHRRGRGPAIANGQERPDPGAGEQPPEIRDEVASKETAGETGDEVAATAEAAASAEAVASAEGGDGQTAAGPDEAPAEAGTDAAGDGAAEAAPEAQAEPVRPKPRRRRSTRTRAAADTSADAEPVPASEDNAPA